MLFRAIGLASLLSFVLLPTGCDAVKQSIEEATEEAAEEAAKPTLVSSKDGKVSISIPPSWSTQTGLNDEADIQVGDLAEEAYLIVLSESKIDFDESVDLAQHSSMTREAFMESLGGAEILAGPKQTKAGELDAVVYDLQGSIDGLRPIYLHATIEGDDFYHQVVAWTLPSKIEANRPIFDRVIESLRETGAAKKPAEKPVEKPAADAAEPNNP
jgi:hypothetical protein